MCEGVNRHVGSDDGEYLKLDKSDESDQKNIIIVIFLVLKIYEPTYD